MTATFFLPTTNVVVVIESRRLKLVGTCTYLNMFDVGEAGGDAGEEGTSGALEAVAVEPVRVVDCDQVVAARTELETPIH
jgi:hypothetical protein